jgi:O-Antigen ligase
VYLLFRSHSGPPPQVQRLKVNPMATSSAIQNADRLVHRWRWDVAGVVLGVTAVSVGSGLLVSQGDWIVPIGLMAVAGVVIAGFEEARSLLVVLTLASLVQAPLGNLGPISDVQPAEIAVPLLLLGVVLKTIVGQGRSERPARATKRPVRLLHLAVGTYVAVILVNVVRSELFLNAPHALRPLYAYVVACGVYFLTYKTLKGSINAVPRLLDFLLSLSAIICVIGVLAVALHVPLNFGNLTFSIYEYASGAVRVGFLGTFGSIGLALVTVGVGGQARLPGAVLFGVAVLLSGGRADALGIALGVLLYLIVTRRAWPLLVTAAVALSLVSVLPTLKTYPQVQRLTNISQSAVATNDRGPFLSAALQEFGRHPLIGTGMGVPAPENIGTTPAVVEFNKEQLEYGGQATYHSLLKLFGLSGFLPFVGALLALLWCLARVARVNAAAAFFFIFATAVAVSMVAGGAGSEPQWFFALGGGAAVLALIDDDRRVPRVFDR